MRVSHIFFATALAAVSTAGCHAGSSATPAPRASAAPVADPGLRTIPISGPRDGMEIVVRDSAHWRSLWPSLADMPENVHPLIPVDFAAEVVVVLALGQHSGADAVIVDSVARYSNITVVHYRARVRQQNCLKRGGPGMYSTPAIAFRLQRPPGPVLFDRRVVEPPC